MPMDRIKRLSELAVKIYADGADKAAMQVATMLRP